MIAVPPVASWRRDPDGPGRQLVGLATSAFKRAVGLSMEAALLAVSRGLDEVHVFDGGMILLVWRSAPTAEQRRAFRSASNTLADGWVRVRTDIRHLIEAPGLTTRTP